MSGSLHTRYSLPAVDDALYSSLCRTIQAICLETQARHSTSGPVLVEWQRWARGFVAGLYHRRSAVRAALLACWEASLLEGDDPEAGQLGHAAAELAWAAGHAAAGEHEKAEVLAHAARKRLAAPLGTTAAVQALGGNTGRQQAGNGAPGAAGEHDAEAVIRARRLNERHAPTASANRPDHL